MLRMFCFNLSMRAGQSGIGGKRTSISVWLVEPRYVNAVYTLHYASVGRVVCRCLEVYQAMLFLGSRSVLNLSPTARRYTAIGPKCDEDLA
jgi:hypothetical protein